MREKKPENPNTISLFFFFILIITLVIGFIYWTDERDKTQEIPPSYRILKEIQSKGLYYNKNGKRVFRSVRGKTLGLTFLRGKVVILNFWATWCEPCLEEFPSFIRLLDSFSEKIVLVAVARDIEKKDVIQFVKAFDGFRENLVIVLDKDEKWSREFGVELLPETFVFDRQGRLLKKIIGTQNWASPMVFEFFKGLQ